MRSKEMDNECGFIDYCKDSKVFEENHCSYFHTCYCSDVNNCIPKFNDFKDKQLLINSQVNEIRRQQRISGSSVNTLNNLSSLKHALPSPSEHSNGYFVCKTLHKRRLFAKTNTDEKTEIKKILNQHRLHQAVHVNDEEKVEFLLKGGADPDQEDYLGQTPLASAVSHGFINIAKLLLHHGANPNKKSHLGTLPIHSALFLLNIPLLHLLMTAGTDMQQFDCEDYSITVALSLCTRQDHGYVYKSSEERIQAKQVLELLHNHAKTVESSQFRLMVESATKWLDFENDFGNKENHMECD